MKNFIFKIKIILATIIFFAFNFFVVGNVSSAISIDTSGGKPDLNKAVIGQIESAAKGPSTTSTKGKISSPQEYIVAVIETVLVTIGMTFIALVVMAGYWRFTANGEETKIEKSNKAITQAVIGLAVVWSAYAITKFISVRIYGSVQEEVYYEYDDVKLKD